MEDPHGDAAECDACETGAPLSSHGDEHRRKSGLVQQGGRAADWLRHVSP